MDRDGLIVVFLYFTTFFLIKPHLPYSTDVFKLFIVYAFILFVVACGTLDYVGTLYPEYKLQKNTQISRREYIYTVLRSILNFIIIFIPCVYGFWKILGWRQTIGWTFSTTTFIPFVIAFLLCGLITEFTSWCIHKLLHYEPLFTYIHSYHHKHIAPVCFSCIDAHPVEVALWDLLPVFIGPILLGTNANLTILFGLYAVLNTIASHSGFKYPFSYFDGSDHDLHHEKMKCNYAGSIFMDVWMDTYEERKDNVNYPHWNRLAKTYEGTYNSTRY